MKHVIMSIGTLLCLTLSGCSAAAFWLSGCGNPDADLVVVNDSRRAVYSIVLEYENSTETVQAASGTALLEPGQSYGLTLEEGEVLVTLRDQAQRTVGQGLVTRKEEFRQFLTFDGVTGGSLSVEEKYNGRR